jgi:hypothetical protein
MSMMYSTQTDPFKNSNKPAPAKVGGEKENASNMWLQMGKK